MRILATLLVLTASSPVFANAEVQSSDGPPMPALYPERIEGPFASADAYCAYRTRQLDADATPEPCDAIELAADAPRALPGQVIRAYRFADLDRTLHVIVETSAGWFGRQVGTMSNGDDASIDDVSLTDIVRDNNAELMFDVGSSHAPCGGCDGDLYHNVTETFACTVIDDALRCTDGITTRDHMHLVDIWSWDATLKIGRDGRAKRTITESERVPRKQLRTLAAPLRVTFHR